MGLFDGYKRKRAIELLNQARRTLPWQSLELYEQATKLFEQIGDEVYIRKAQGGYYKALGKMLIHQNKYDEAIKALKTARWIFTNLGEWEETSEVKADIADVYLKKGDVSELKELLRNYLLSVDFKEINYDVLGCMCDALDIRADVLVRILLELQEEGLVSRIGEVFIINKRDVKEIEVTHGQPTPLAQAIRCPVCYAPIKRIAQLTKCDYCGSHLRLNLASSHSVSQGLQKEP